MDFSYHFYNQRKIFVLAGLFTWRECKFTEIFFAIGTVLDSLPFPNPACTREHSDQCAIVMQQSKHAGHLSLSLPITKFSILNLVLNLVYMYTTPVYYTKFSTIYTIMYTLYVYIYIYIYVYIYIYIYIIFI